MLLDYLVSTLVYMKPIWRSEIKPDGTTEKYVYQDECEWRYIHFPEELHLILPQNETSELGRQKYSEVLANHQECWLCFEWNDVRYIMAPNEAAAKQTILCMLRTAKANTWQSPAPTKSLQD